MHNLFGKHNIKHNAAAIAIANIYVVWLITVTANGQQCKSDKTSSLSTLVR